MSDHDAGRRILESGRPYVSQRTSHGGEPIWLVMEWQKGDAEPTPDDPRWREVQPELPPEWLHGWKGDGEWPDAKPQTLDDVAEWLRKERDECVRWESIVSEEFAAERLSVSVANAVRLCRLVTTREPIELREDENPWQKASKLLRWLEGTADDGQAGEGELPKERSAGANGFSGRGESVAVDSRERKLNARRVLEDKTLELWETMNRPQIRTTLRSECEHLLKGIKGETALDDPGYPADSTLTDWKKSAESRGPVS